jgi:hypothetical protein
MPEVPLNIQEFNTIAGLIFAQLYKAFPVVEDIDRAGIAKAMGVVGNDWSKHKLPSGLTFSDLLAHTVSWLSVEDYTRAAGAHPGERVMLTTKGLAAMSAVPSGLKESLGTELKKAVEKGSSLNYGAIGDLVGGLFSGFTKGMASG